MTLTRREALGAAVATASTAALLTSTSASAEEPKRPAPSGTTAAPAVVKPLPFDPAKLKGLSEKLLRSHHENNYAGAVKNLNRAGDELSRLTKDSAPFLAAGLREKELTFRNSATLHEHYFGNLGGDGKPGGAIEKALARAHGSLARWEEEFRLTALGLAGGSGWVVVSYDFHRGELALSAAANHTQALAFGQPLLVLDMFEHAFHLDYGAAAAKYVDAFFQNLQWDEVNRRLERAEKAQALLRPA